MHVEKDEGCIKDSTLLCRHLKAQHNRLRFNWGESCWLFACCRQLLHRFYTLFVSRGIVNVRSVINSCDGDGKMIDGALFGEHNDFLIVCFTFHVSKRD